MCHILKRFLRNILTNFLSYATFTILIAQGQLSSHYIQMEDEPELPYTICVDQQSTLSEMVKQASNELIQPSDNDRFHHSEAFSINFCLMQKEDRYIIQFAKKARALARSYEAGITANEAEDIAYIVKTLSNSSLPKIKGAESSLKKAGDRIDAVHPLQFLITVFLNEELKVALRNLKGRSWVWSDFLKGITETLSEENGKNNISPYLNDFASIINVDVNAIAQFQQNGRWDKFVMTLIAIVPRAGSADRYQQ